MPVFIKREYDYAIRICAYLAGNYKKGPIPVSKIAELLYISKPFATKIIYQLTSKKIITSVQGKAGGVYLSHNPERLSLFAILQAMNFDSTINECIKVPTLCPLKAACKIHDFFYKQESALINNLKEATIAEFAFDNSAIEQNKTS
jgi:Rrf2 family transcriptional regulator, nitric oxide-sensitive transcriptional repressor